MGTLPEFLDPESKRYQPWAEKQTGNAAKEKRPLAEFLDDFQARLAAVGDWPAQRWRPWSESRSLARFGTVERSEGARRGTRRGRRGARPAAPASSGRPAAATGRDPRAQGQRGPADAPPGPVTAPRRRRRRRRPRGAMPPPGPDSS